MDPTATTTDAPPLAATDKDIAKHVLSRLGRPRFAPAGQSVLQVNFYGLLALATYADGDVAVIIPESANHEAKLWWSDDSFVTHSEGIVGPLVFGGLTTGSVALTLSDAEHPWDDLNRIYQEDGALHYNKFQRHCRLPSGRVFAGQPFRGSRLLFRRARFKNQQALMGDPSFTTFGPRFAMTDNFNWISEVTSTVQIERLNKPPIVLTPKSKGGSDFYVVSITSDVSPKEPGNTGNVLHHHRYFAPLVNRSIDADITVPVFDVGQLGEDRWQEGSSDSSQEPSCNAMWVKG